jgi:hypothetical protein
VEAEIVHFTSVQRWRILYHNIYKWVKGRIDTDFPPPVWLVATAPLLLTCLLLSNAAVNGPSLCLWFLCVFFVEKPEKYNLFRFGEKKTNPPPLHPLPMKIFHWHNLSVEMLKYLFQISFKVGSKVYLALLYRTVWVNSGIAPHILKLSTRWTKVVSFSSRPLYISRNFLLYSWHWRHFVPQSKSEFSNPKKHLLPRKWVVFSWSFIPQPSLCTDQGMPALFSFLWREKLIFIYTKVKMYSLGVITNQQNI